MWRQTCGGGLAHNIIKSLVNYSRRGGRRGNSGGTSEVYTFALPRWKARRGRRERQDRVEDEEYIQHFKYIKSRVRAKEKEIPPKPEDRIFKQKKLLRGYFSLTDTGKSG